MSIKILNNRQNKMKMKINKKSNYNEIYSIINFCIATFIIIFFYYYIEH